MVADDRELTVHPFIAVGRRFEISVGHAVTVGSGRLRGSVINLFCAVSSARLISGRARLDIGFRPPEKSPSVHHRFDE